MCWYKDRDYLADCWCEAMEQTAGTIYSLKKQHIFIFSAVIKTKPITSSLVSPPESPCLKARNKILKSNSLLHKQKKRKEKTPNNNEKWKKRRRKKEKKKKKGKEERHVSLVVLLQGSSTYQLTCRACSRVRH